MKAKPAKPIVRIGDYVRYRDHHGRPQSGRVQYIEAKWFTTSSPDQEPSITYCVDHPTYFRRRHYTDRVKP